MKRKPSKCEFFKSHINYLGHIVSAGGIECDPKKIEAVKNWPVPRTVTDIRSFLGFTNHYRWFICNYARIARSLNKLISGDNANHKKKTIEWTEDCQIAFDQLKEKCTQTPILAYANYKKPFVLHTDASEMGLGAVLYQKDDQGVKKVIAYASRMLSQSEKRYPAHKLEFLAVKWAVTDQFDEYLYGGTFDVYTDNNPLTYVLTSAKLDATGQRWIAKLANYTFQLYYESGKTNIEADALSRIDHDYLHISPEVVKAITTAVQLNYLSNFVSEADHLVAKSIRFTVAAKINNEQWQMEQSKVISKVLEALRNKTKTSAFSDEDVKCLLRHQNHLVVCDQLLYRKNIDSMMHTKQWQFVLPTIFREQALQACHDNIGHLGIECTTHLLKDRFYWPHMQLDIERYIKQFPRCLRFKAVPEQMELNPIVATRPWELIHIDFLTIEATANSKSGKDVNVLIITDHFTRYVQAFVTASQQAPVVAKILWDRFFMYFGLPEKILTDQGQNFESKLITELCLLTQIKKLRTTPYTPQTNGACERFNRTLISMIGTLPDEYKAQWPQHIPMLVHAYNCTRSNATGYSPFYLLYGRKPLLPIDIEFGVYNPNVSDTITSKYIKKLKRSLEWAIKKAHAYSQKEKQRAKINYDRKIRCSKLGQNDIVLVQRTGFQSKHKIADRWEIDFYKVISQRDNLLVYLVRNLSNNKERVLHRNMLYPVQFGLDSEVNINSDASNESVINQNLDDGSPDVSVSAVPDETNSPIYHRPQTRSRTKCLMKANIMMNELFDVNSCFVPSPSRLTWFSFYMRWWNQLLNLFMRH